MRLIVFDVDGTLVDSQAVIVAAMARAFAAHDLPPPQLAAILATIGLSPPEAMAELVGPDGPAVSLAKAYKSASWELKRDRDHHEVLFPGMGALVKRLSDQSETLLGIATGKSRRGVRTFLDQHEFQGRFVTIQTADDHPSKPNPSMLHQAMAETGVTADETTFVGDTSYDMIMAQAIGARGIGVAWGYHPVDALEGAGAEMIADTADHLAELLEDDACMATNTRVETSR
ncbi:MAG: HAD-IA family hydrolase [Pseudomonadota bacterium]